MLPDQISDLNSLGLLFTLFMGILLVSLPRRFALVPVVLITCYMTFGQKIQVAGLHFTMLRLLVLFGCVRTVFRSEFRPFHWYRMDTVILVWAFFSITIYTLLWQTSEALINRLGTAYDAVGLYFMFRFLVRDIEDIVRAAKMFAVVLFPVAICMSVEYLSGGKNMFYVFGGVPEFSVIREGVLRCQGPFGHPILAGTFGAVWLPLFVGIWWQNRKNRLFAMIGTLSSFAITYLSGSSGPIMVFMAGVLGCAVWPLHRRMRAIRWGIVLGVIALQLAMKEPVWFVYARVNILSGSTGWHRSHLIDQTVMHFFDWWLLGVKSVEAWGVWAGDVTNQFILEGVRGGLITFVLFAYIVVLAFSGVGSALLAASKGPRQSKLFLWAIGCMFFSHIMAFQNVAYFDQSMVNWYLSLAMVGVAVNVYCPRIACEAGAPAEIDQPQFGIAHSSESGKP
jgi:hypothetical protein